MADKSRYRIEAVFQAAQVIKMVSEIKGAAGPSEIAERLGITVNTAYRMCVTLEEAGFLTQVGDKYDLGMGIALIYARTKAHLECQKEEIEKNLAAIL